MSAENHVEEEKDNASAEKKSSEGMFKKDKNGGKGKSPDKDNVKELQGRFDELNDKYLRLYSDFENFRKRVNKEKIELITFGNKDLLLAILPVVDDFERAVEVLQSGKEENPALEGILLIYNKLKNTLQQSGLKEIEAKGAEFDPELHEALTKIPAPQEDMKGKVVDVVQKGYALNDKVIRHARVVVGE